MNEEYPMTLADIQSRVTTHAIDSALTVVCILHRCHGAKADLADKILTEDYEDWHYEHLTDFDDPNQYLYDLVKWVQERAKYHIAERILVNFNMIAAPPTTIQ